MADGVLVRRTPISDYSTACIVDVASYDSVKRRVVGKLTEVFINKRINPDQRFFVYECSMAATDGPPPPPLVVSTMGSDGSNVVASSHIAVEDAEKILSDKNVALKKDCIKLAVMRQREEPVAHKWVELTTFELPFFEPMPGKSALFVTTGLEYWPVELNKTNLDTIKKLSF